MSTRLCNLLIVLCVLALLDGCATSARRKVDNTCAFAYFLPLPVSIVAVAGCTFGADAVLQDQDEEEDGDG